MGGIPLRIRPGVNVQKTPLLQEAGLADANLIRHFRDEGDSEPLIQKIGGWSRLVNDRLVGSCRAIHPWADLAGNGYYAFGSEYQVAVYPLAAGHIFDITPSSATNALTNQFTTTPGSPVVTIHDVTTSPSANDWILIGNSVYIDGLALQGFYQVQSANPGAHTYTINAGANALAGVAGGGTLITFTTINGQSNVAIAQGARVFQAGQVISIYTQTTVGGIVILGSYTVQIVGGQAFIGGDAFANAGANATENAGAAVVRYLSLAPKPDGSLSGYGQGAYGAGLFGVGQQSTSPPRQWALDNFGADLVGAPLAGPLIAWSPPFVAGTYAAAVSGAPQYSNSIFVAMPQEQVVSLGSDGGGFQDPLLIRWCNVGNYVGSGNWTASATNQAGSFRLTAGTKIIGGMQGPQQGFIWTDLSLWTQNYVGFPLVYSFLKVADGCGLMCPRGASYIDGRLVWMGRRGVWEYDGATVNSVPCSVWDFFFNNVDFSNLYNVHCAPNAYFGEVAWYFPTIGSNGVPTNYIKLNLRTGLWDKGVLSRTGWSDASAVCHPLGVDGINGLVQQHEVSTDADGVAMSSSYILTGLMRINEGSDFFALERLIPDFILNAGATVNVSVTVYRYPNDPMPRTYGPLPVTAATQFKVNRCRGGYFQLKFDFSTFGTFARLGLVKAVGGLAGKRP